MARTSKAGTLTAVALDSFVAKNKAVINDGGGLILRKRATGYFWYYRNTSPETKRETWHTLAERAPYPSTTLQAARKLAAKVRSSADTGVDLKQERKRVTAEKQRIEDEEIAAQKQRVTLQVAFDRWVDIDLKPAIRADGKRIGRIDGGQSVREQFERHVFAEIGELEMKAVSKAQLMALLDKHIALGQLRTANVLLANLKQFFRFAVD
jgi:Arm DNA-binding domain